MFPLLLLASAINLPLLLLMYLSSPCIDASAESSMPASLPTTFFSLAHINRLQSSLEYKALYTVKFLVL